MKQLSEHSRQPVVIPLSKEFEKRQDLYPASQRTQLSALWLGLEVCSSLPSGLNQTPLFIPFWGAIEILCYCPQAAKSDTASSQQYEFIN